jgi:hypothetical protein
MPVLLSNVGAFGTAIAAAALTFTGYAPTLAVQGNTNVTPAAGSAVVTGYAPLADLGGRQAMGPGILFGLNLLSSPEGVAVPLTAYLTATGYAPFADNPDSYIEPVGSDDITAEPATISGTAVKVVVGLVDRYPPQGSGAFSGYALTLDAGMPLTAATVAATGYEPALAFAAVLPALGTLTATGYAPDLLFLEEQVRSVPKGSGTFAGYAPELLYLTMRPDVGQGTFASNGFTLNLGMPLPAASGTFAGYVPTIVNTGNIVTGSGTPTGRRATVSGDAYPVIEVSASIEGEPATLTDEVFYVRVGTGDLQAGAASLNTSAITFNAVLSAGRATINGVGLVLEPYGPLAFIATRGSTNTINLTGSTYSIETKGTASTIT